jgi:hypothetical protein
MGIKNYVRQVRPVQEAHVNHLDRIQSFLSEGMLDLNILKNTLRGSSILRGEVLVQAVKDGTPIETNKGVVKLSWMDDESRIAAEGGDYVTAFKSGRSFKKVFVTDNGDKLKLSDIKKSAMFGGGKGSGGGSEITAAAECAQCIYAAAIFGGKKLSVGDEIPSTEWSSYSTNFDVDMPLGQVESLLDQSWWDSSISIGNEMKKNIKGTYIFHRGSSFVKEINTIFKNLNKAEKPKPFSDMNKWNPADIWAVKSGASFDFNKHTSLGAFTNELKELYDSGDLIGISLKKVTSDNVNVVPVKTTGFIRTPVTYGGFEKQNDTSFFNSKDYYILLKKERMQLRTFSAVSSWQGEVKGNSAAAGKIGGGVLEAIMIKNSTLTKFPYNNRTLKGLVTNPKKNPQFLEELYDMFVKVEKSSMKKEVFVKAASANKIGRVSGADWRFSKYRGLFVVLFLEDNKRGGARSIASKITDNIAAYSMSQSDEAAPHVVYK